MKKPLFNIDFTTWKLPKNPITGLPVEPVPNESFDRFEYWSDQLNRPVRQVIPKNASPTYVDFLNRKDATLFRCPCSVGVSAYDDEITKEAYEELCQKELLKYHFNKQINYNSILPFQTLALTFIKYQEKQYVLKINGLYSVNIKKRLLEKVASNTEDITNDGEKISEYKFYYLTIKELIKINGIEFLYI